MTLEQIHEQLVAVNERIQSQTQAILAATTWERKEDLMSVRDSFMLEMVNLLTAQSELHSTQAQEMQDQLQGLGSDFRVLKN